MLGFVEKNLMSGETVVKKAEFSKKFIYPPLIVFSPILLVFTIFFLGSSIHSAKMYGDVVFNIFCGILATILFNGVAYLVLTWRRRKILKRGSPAITNKRILGISGVGAVLDAPFDSIESVAVYGGIFGSLFGYGAVWIKLRDTVPYVFFGIVKPIEFKNEVMKIVLEKKTSE
jgi:hypothetical protein